LSTGGLLERCGDISVIGFGTTGRAVVDYLAGEDIELFVSENNKIPPALKDDLNNRGIEFEENGNTEKVLASDLIVLSPGVPPNRGIAKKARKLGVATIGEIELAYRLSPTERIIGVTGTNGKSTTVNLINELLTARGTSSVACGNIGTPFISVLQSLEPTDVAVVEVSSYQLQTTENFKPRVAVLTNLEPDHLGRHGSFEEYRDAKLRLFRNQDEECYSVINEKLMPEISIQNIKPAVVEFHPAEPEELDLMPHQKENVGAALAAADCILEQPGSDSVPVEPVARGLELPHRLEPVNKINDVEFVNDSKATNPAATRAAVEGFSRPLRLLLGGKQKSSGYRKLIEGLEAHPIRKVYLFGSARPKLAETFRSVSLVKFDTFSSLEGAVTEAFEDAERGEVVLLSPGCSSFDSFSNFEERGRKFREIVDGLVDCNNP